MEYKLYGSSAIKEGLKPKNLLKSILAVVLLLVPVIVMKMVLSEDLPQIITYIIAITGIVPIAAILAVTIISGWSISGDTMEIRSFSGGKQLKISAMEIAMKDCDSEWAPKWRTWGVGLPGLLLGYFSLKNKKSALLFEHLGGAQELVIKVADKYYIINHAGIADLYKELIRLGAKEGI
mgnify:CR=1 FL=1